MSEINRYNLVALVLGYTQDMLIHAQYKEWDLFELKVSRRHALYKIFCNESFTNPKEKTFVFSVIDFVHTLNKEMSQRKNIKSYFDDQKSKLNDIIILPSVSKKSTA